MVINGVLWRTRSSAPWWDLPGAYGNRKTVYNRHRRWSGDGTWERILDELRRGADQDQGQHEEPGHNDAPESAPSPIATPRPVDLQVIPKR